MHDLGAAIEQPIPIREQVLKRLSELIMSGRIRPSERLVEGKLASQLGVSRTPVREALHVLEMEGFIEAMPRIGYQVRNISWDELDQLCEIRAVTETLAVRWAIEKMTPDALSALEENLKGAEAEARTGINERFIDLDAEFHDILFRASGSVRLGEICRLLRRHMYLYRLRGLHMDSAARTIEGHRAILNSIKQCDVSGAAQAVRDHLKFVKEDCFRHAFGEQHQASSDEQSEPSGKLAFGKAGQQT